MLGLGRVKPVWLAEIGTRTAESFDGDNWTFLPSLSRAKVATYGNIFVGFLLELSTKCFTKFGESPALRIFAKQIDCR